MEIDQVKMMIQNNISLKEIKKATGFSVAFLNQIKKQLPKKQTEMHKIEQLYQKGYTVTRIHRVTGISVNQIEYYIYRQEKLHVKYKDRTKVQDEKKQVKIEVFQEYSPEKIERIIKLTNFGYLPQEIAEDQEISTAKVRQIIMQAEQMNRIRKII